MSIRMGPRDNLGEYRNQLGGSIYMSGRPSIAGSRRDSVGSSYSQRNSIVGGMRRDSVQFLGHRDSIVSRRDSVSSSGSIVMRVLQARDSQYSRTVNDR